MESSAIAAPPAPLGPPPGPGPGEAPRPEGGFAQHMRRAEERPAPTNAAPPRTARPEAAEPDRPPSTTDTAIAANGPVTPIEEAPEPQSAGLPEPAPAPVSEPTPPPAAAAPPEGAVAALTRPAEPGTALAVPIALPDSLAAAVAPPVALPVPVMLAPTPATPALPIGQSRPPDNVTAAAHPASIEEITSNAPDGAAPMLPPPVAGEGAVTASRDSPTPPESGTAAAPAPITAAPAKAAVAAHILAATAPVRTGPQTLPAEATPTSPATTAVAAAAASDRAPEIGTAPAPATPEKPAEAISSRPQAETAAPHPRDLVAGEPGPARDDLARAAPGAPLSAPLGEGAPGSATAPAPAPASAIITAPANPTEPPRAAPQAPPARQIAPLAAALAYGARDGEAATLSVALDPGELGRVEISVERSGGLTAIRVTAERAETLALLQRDQRELGQSLSQAGVQEAGRSISFSLSGQGGGQRQGQPPPGQHGAALPWTTAADPSAAPLADHIRPRVARSLLDLAL